MVDVQAIELHGDGLRSFASRKHLEPRGGRGWRAGRGLCCRSLLRRSRARLAGGARGPGPRPAGALGGLGLRAVTHGEAREDGQRERQCSPSVSDRWVHSVHPPRRALGEPNGMIAAHLGFSSLPARRQEARSSWSPGLLCGRDDTEVGPPLRLPLCRGRRLG